MLLPPHPFLLATEIFTRSTKRAQNERVGGEVVNRSALGGHCRLFPLEHPKGLAKLEGQIGPERVIRLKAVHKRKVRRRLGDKRSCLSLVRPHNGTAQFRGGAGTPSREDEAPTRLRAFGIWAPSAWGHRIRYYPLKHENLIAGHAVPMTALESTARMSTEAHT